MQGGIFKGLSTNIYLETWDPYFQDLLGQTTSPHQLLASPILPLHREVEWSWMTWGMNTEPHPWLRGGGGGTFKGPVPLLAPQSPPLILLVDPQITDTPRWWAACGLLWDSP